MAETYTVRLTDPPSDYPAPNYDISTAEHEEDSTDRVIYSLDWWVDISFGMWVPSDALPPDYEERVYAERFATNPAYHDENLWSDFRDAYDGLPSRYYEDGEPDA